MPHIEPQQATTRPARPAQHRSSWWPPAAIALLLTLGGGAALTHWLPPSESDRVSREETAARVEAFMRVAPLQLTKVAGDKRAAALLEMRLEPSRREELGKALGQTADAPTPPQPAVAAAPASPAPLELVELTLWDSHAPDGDVVKVVSAGYSREIVLGKTPTLIYVPAADGQPIQIIGVHDGGGGITLGLQGSTVPLMLPIMSEGQTLALPVRF